MANSGHGGHDEAGRGRGDEGCAELAQRACPLGAANAV